MSTSTTGLTNKLLKPLLVSASFFGISYGDTNSDTHSDTHSDNRGTQPKRKITPQQLATHNHPDRGVWMSYRNRVYDVTKFMESHPGGKDKLMMAAGKSVEPFWKIYPQHLKSEYLTRILPELEIGELEVHGTPTTTEPNSDPYRDDPKRHPALYTYTEQPCNASCPTELILDNWITPNPLWYVRNHHPVPKVDPDKYELSVMLPNMPCPIIYGLGNLRSEFPKQKLVATLACGGNRRSEYNSVRLTSGTPWNTGAISNARWSGVWLYQLFRQHGVTLESMMRHHPDLKFLEVDTIDGLKVSIPIHKALDPLGGVMLAYEMNRDELPPDHGYPLRLIVPGYVGVRNAKHIKSLRFSAQEVEGPWQSGMAYKGFAPNRTDVGNLNLRRVASVQELPVNSAIVYPAEGSKLSSDEPVTIRGWAWSGGGRGIVRVDVSIDGGETWQEATLTEGCDQPDHQAWAWTFWECEVDSELVKGEQLRIVCKAVDASYNTQPESLSATWNLRGLVNNTWGRSTVQVVD